MPIDLNAVAKKYAHLMIIAGAFLVFLTFIFKEGLHEYWDRTSQEIQMARYIYEVRIEESSLGRTMTQMKERPVQQFTFFNAAYNECQEDLKALREIDSDMSYLSILSDSLPKSHGTRERMAEAHIAAVHEIEERIEKKKNEAAIQILPDERQLRAPIEDLTEKSKALARISHKK